MVSNLNASISSDQPRSSGIGLPKVALVGNPNAGKTSVFNALTGSNQRIGNYPGVTVERATGRMTSDGATVEIVDVPGLYSLTPVSADESVAVLEIVGNQDNRPADLLVYVLDASNVERNLFLLSQLAESKPALVVALTQTDMAEKESAAVDADKLSDHLGVDVIPIIAHRGVGVAELRQAIVRNLDSPRVPDIDVGFPAIVIDAADRLVEQFARAGIDLTRKEARCMLLDAECTTIDRFRTMPELIAAIDAEREGVLGASGQGKTIDAQSRFSWAAKVRREVTSVVQNGRRRQTSDVIDSFLTHRVFGLVFFVGLMYLVFQSIDTFAGPLMEGIDIGVTYVADIVRPLLASAPVIQSLVVDGIIIGVGSVLVFLPQIIILFLCIAILEGTGYLARAAFLMDKLLGWCGLNGRAFIPLLSSFACAIPGVMAARVMPDSRSRLVTVLVAPLMSCSARLPVYVLMIGAFIEPKYGPAWAGFALFAMHFVGLMVAIPVVFILNRGVFRSKRLPFLLEMPRYQWPKWRDVLLTITSRVKVFISTAGTIIVAMSILIWALLYFPTGERSKARFESEYASLSAQRREQVTIENYLAERQREESYLGQFGRTLEPVFAPAGFDWRLTTAILAAFPAREVVVPAMGILFGQGEVDDTESVDLRTAMERATWPDGRPLLDVWSAISLMVFFALCCQCMATLAAIKRETNSWKWPLFTFTYMTVLAYVISVGIVQFGHWVNR